MENKELIFIPYQDTDNFYSDGILTREYAILYVLYKRGYKNVINVKKPRTILDKKEYVINENFYPEGTVENYVKGILDNARTIQYLPLLSVSQLLQKRGWWSKGYKRVAKDILNEVNVCSECLVYSNNPYASGVLNELKQRRCKVYFDVMDNFAIHPSLNRKEREKALKGYKEVFKIADIVSANSHQTCEYMLKEGARDVILAKNGVFLNNEINDVKNCKQFIQIKEEKKKYNKTVGYIGKLGKRLDAELIAKVSMLSKDILFVFVGPYLEGQLNEKLIKLFKGKNNILHLEGIPSAYVYEMLNQFDILMIPHSVGKNENGGDPLKLYQYLTRKKPIITTPILGVEEFQGIIKISNKAEDWIEFIAAPHYEEKELNIHFDWDSRLAPVMKEID